MQTKLKNRQGFTIIEVMIVLAIAGLIMLIVFLAVPALQRSSRNTSRKNDASRLATSVSSFVSNANGTLPCESTGSVTAAPDDATTVLNDAGKLGQLTFSSSLCSTTASATAGTFLITGAAPNPNAELTPTDNAVVVFLGATCSGSYATPGSTRQAALIYPIETTGSTPYTWSCISAL